MGRPAVDADQPVTRLTLSQPMPDGGWPRAPCRRYMTDHPAHGWQGPTTGRIYWCSQTLCQAVRRAWPAPPPETING